MLYEGVYRCKGILYEYFVFWIRNIEKSREFQFHYLSAFLPT